MFIKRIGEFIKEVLLFVKGHHGSNGVHNFDYHLAGNLRCLTVLFCLARVQFGTGNRGKSNNWHQHKATKSHAPVEGETHRNATD